MKEIRNEIVRLKSDSEININRLKAELAKVGISSIVKNEFQSALIAGYGANPTAVDLYVSADSFPEAAEVLQDLEKATKNH